MSPVSCDGKKIDKATPGNYLRVALAQLELTQPGLGWYEATRHTFASQWVLAGNSIEKLSAILGHYSVVMTERYAHLRPELFTQADLTIGNTQIPVGAYSLFMLPGKDRWTLVVNKNVKPGEYNLQQDLVRVPMDVAQISEPQGFSLVFAHMAPKQCNIRMYQGKTGAWAEFHEK